MLNVGVVYTAIVKVIISLVMPLQARNSLHATKYAFLTSSSLPRCIGDAETESFQSSPMANSFSRSSREMK